MAINALIKPRKTEPDDFITTISSTELVLALQKIDDSKRKILINGLWYDLRTITIEIDPERGGDFIITLKQYGSEARFGETISYADLISVLESLHRSKSLFQIVGTHYFDLRTLAIEIPIG